jgi:hypothetical protein
VWLGITLSLRDRCSLNNGRFVRPARPAVRDPERPLVIFGRRLMSRCNTIFVSSQPTGWTDFFPIQLLDENLARLCQRNPHAGGITHDDHLIPRLRRHLGKLQPPDLMRNNNIQWLSDNLVDGGLALEAIYDACIADTSTLTY